jgi:hypothetical protein
MSVQMVKLPSIERYVVGDINRLMPYVLGGSIATEITGYGKEFKDLHKGSITLGEQAALWNAYLMSERGELDLGEAKDAIYSLFGNLGTGNVTDDACNYDGGEKLRKLNDSDRSVEWIIRPEAFEKKGGIWQARLGPKSDVRHILVPAPGYVALTCDGSYRPDTGTPFTTVKSRTEAEKSWIDRGYSPEFANKAVSYFYSRNENEGMAAVWRRFSGGDYGRFVVFAVRNPDFRSSDIGSLGVSRDAERSEAGLKKGTIVLREKEYRALAVKAGKFDTLKRLANE